MFNTWIVVMVSWVYALEALKSHQIEYIKDMQFMSIS